MLSTPRIDAAAATPGGSIAMQQHEWDTQHRHWSDATTASPQVYDHSATDLMQLQTPIGGGATTLDYGATLTTTSSPNTHSHPHSHSSSSSSHSHQLSLMTPNFMMTPMKHEEHQMQYPIEHQAKEGEEDHNTPPTQQMHHQPTQSTSSITASTSSADRHSPTCSTQIGDSPPDTPDTMASITSSDGGSGSGATSVAAVPSANNTAASSPRTLPPRSQSRHAHLSVKTEETHAPTPYHPAPAPAPAAPQPATHHHHGGLTAQQQAAALAEQQAHRAAEIANSSHQDDDGEEEEDCGGRHTATSESKMKRGHGSSCHQCKTTKDPQFLFFCTNKAEKGVRKRRCRKKYCDSCLKRSYGSDASEIIPSWQCPSCLGACICAACHRKTSKKGGATAAANAQSAAAAGTNAVHQQSETIKHATMAERRAAAAAAAANASGPDDSPDPLSMPKNARASSSTVSRTGLSPLTMSRGLSDTKVGEHIRNSPRFTSRSLATGKGNSNNNSHTNLASLDSGSSTLIHPLPIDLDPFVQQNEELEKLMVGMNMQQRQTFLHDAANLVLPVTGSANSSTTNSPAQSGKILGASPRTQARSIKRKGSSNDVDLSSPTQTLKFNMQQRLKRDQQQAQQQLQEQDQETTIEPIGLPPRGTPPNPQAKRLQISNPSATSASASASGSASSHSTTTLPPALPSLASPLGLAPHSSHHHHHHHHHSSGSHNMLHLSTPSAATLLPDEHLEHHVDHHDHHTTSSDARHQHAFPSETPSSERHPIKQEHQQPEYLQWGSHGTGASSSMLSPMPGSLLMNYPSAGGISSFGLGSPNPMMTTPSASEYSVSNSSGLFTPNPAGAASTSALSSPNPYGSAMIYPSTYQLPVPPSSSDFGALRQVSVGGQNILMEQGEMERGMSAMSVKNHSSSTTQQQQHPPHSLQHPLSHHRDTSVDHLFSSEISAYRQTSANSMMAPTTPTAEVVR